MDAAKRKYLEEKSVEYKVNPVALGFFGGCYDINKMSWFFKKISHQSNQNSKELVTRNQKLGFMI